MKSRLRIFDTVILFTLLTLVYSFFYSGTFLTDDEHILSSRALSFAFEGDFNNGRVLGNDRVFEYSMVPEPWANQALNIEPAQPVAGGLLAIISTILNLGHIQLMFLLNIWVTAATAAIVYLSAVRMGYSRVVGYLVAALFGLGTITMPYARTFFRDPLAMFFLAAAWYVAILIRQSNQVEPVDAPKTAVLWVVFSCLFLAGVLSKNTVIVALPILLLEIALHRPQKTNQQNGKKVVKKGLIPLIIIIALMLCWVLIVPSIPMLTRFSPKYYFTVFQKFFAVPPDELVPALLGPFISPGKSIFIFSPVLLLSIWSMLFRFRSSWLAWLYLIFLVLFQALFYGSEWAGHINWGLRYVLPALPLLVLASAPAVDALLKKRKGIAFLTFLLFLSFLIQISGSVVPVRQFYLDSLYGTPPISEFTTIWNAKASILPWSVNWILSAKPLDLAVSRNPAVFWILGPSIVIILLISISCKIKKLQWISVIALVFTIILNFGMVALYRNDSAYSFSRADFRQAQDHIRSQFQTGDLVLVKSYSENLWNYWMNWGDKSIPWTSLPIVPPSISQGSDTNTIGNPEAMIDKITLWIFKNQLPAGRRVWLIGDETTLMNSYDADAVWLKMYFIGSDCLRFTDNQYSTRVCLFEKK